jgi:hypothetical protein
VQKFEQKIDTSRDSPCCKDATSFKTVERLSVPVIYFGYHDSSSGTPPIMWWALLLGEEEHVSFVL